MSGERVERDSMGEVKVPATAKWRAQTQRAVENFPISGVRLERGQIEALARIKSAVASVKAERGMIEHDLAAAIISAAEEVARGDHDDQFPIDVFQTGSGTSSNMNMNEVLATLAGERLGRSMHPNDDVNHPMSSNDMFPPPSTSPQRPAWSATSSRRSSTSPRHSSARPASSPMS